MCVPLLSFRSVRFISFPVCYTILKRKRTLFYVRSLHVVRAVIPFENLSNYHVKSICGKSINPLSSMEPSPKISFCILFVFGWSGQHNFLPKDVVFVRTFIKFDWFHCKQKQTINSSLSKQSRCWRFQTECTHNATHGNYKEPSCRRRGSKDTSQQEYGKLENH